jgi:hypothetical protein
MKKIAIVALMVVAIASSMLGQAKNGGIAREVAMGGSNVGTNLVMNPFIMDDPSLMLMNPAYQAMYTNYGWMNVAGGQVNGLTGGSNGYGHQNAGVAFGLNSEWSVGAVLSYDPSAVNMVNQLIKGVGFGSIAQRQPQTIPNVANVWEVVVANHMSSMDWGFGVMMGTSNNDSKSSSTQGNATSTSSSEASSSMWGFRAGVNAPFGSGNSLDASAVLRLDKATDKIANTAGSQGDYSASGTEIEIHARGKFNVSSKFNFVPYGTFINVSAEPKEDAKPIGAAGATPLSLKYTATAYAFGLGGEYHTSTFYLAGGFSWQSGQMKIEGANTAQNSTGSQTMKYTGLPVVNIGGEWWFTEWLAGRCGYYRSNGTVNIKSENAGTGFSGTSESNLYFPNSLIGIGTMPTGNDDGLVTLGFGMRFGGFGMDATFSEEALRRGLGLVGASDNINTFGYVTASYNFAGE